MAKGFGTRLRSLREAKHLGIRTLAARLGVCHTYVSHMEHGRRFPAPSLVRRIALALGADQEELMLLAGRLPKDVKEILRDFPFESVDVLRRAFDGKPGKQALPGER